MTTSADWHATQYSRFEQERTRPVRDLLHGARAADVRTAVDLGCGPGNSTQTLLEFAPGAQVVGIDSSADMIAAAKARLPNVAFELADISSWRATRAYDLILANASLQWVPDHDALFPALVESLAPGGRLAVQMPDNLDEPAHRLMRETALDGPWRERLAGVGRTVRFSAEWYFSLLKPLCTEVDVWRTTYYHPLHGGIDAVVEWFKGSALRPFLAKLDLHEQAEFLEVYRGKLVGSSSSYSVMNDGGVLLPFPRVFVVAAR